MQLACSESLTRSLSPHCSLVCSLAGLFARWFARSLVRSLAGLFARWFVRSLIHLLLSSWESVILDVPESGCSELQHIAPRTHARTQALWDESVKSTHTIHGHESRYRIPLPSSSACLQNPIRAYEPDSQVRALCRDPGAGERASGASSADQRE